MAESVLDEILKDTLSEVKALLLFPHIKVQESVLIGMHISKDLQKRSIIVESCKISFINLHEILFIYLYTNNNDLRLALQLFEIAYSACHKNLPLFAC